MFKDIKALSDYFNQENESPSLSINPNLLNQYSLFKNWLIENGAIFNKNIDFPYTYGPFNLIGCKSISEIKENESILLIPKKLMIISKELTYLDEYIEEIEEELYEDIDMPTLYLTLHLCLEINNKKSFFRPYFDLILSNKNFLDNFTEENLKFFEEDDNIVMSIKETINELNELYDIIKEGKKFNNISKKEFLFCYSQVVSRQFYIDKHCTALIPLADLLNHNNLMVHYELYDSENYVFKYTYNFTVSSDLKKDIVPTFIKEYPKNNDINIIKEIKPFNIKGKNNNDETEDNIIINENDFFSISTSKGEKISKGKQVFNNYYNGGNKYLLTNYGFCLIDNVYDNTIINFFVEKGKDIYLDKYLEIVFGKKYKMNKNPFYNILKIKIYFNEANFYLVKYFRFLYFYESVKDIKQYVNYKFDIDLEIGFIKLAIERLKLKFNCDKIEELNELENELFNNKEKINYFKVNALIYRITQKRNILNQIELYEFILSIINKYKKEIKCYKDILLYQNDFINISKYDTDENSKIKIIKFIIKSHNFVS